MSTRLTRGDRRQPPAVGMPDEGVGGGEIGRGAARGASRSSAVGDALEHVGSLRRLARLGFRLCAAVSISTCRFGHGLRFSESRAALSRAALLPQAGRGGNGRKWALLRGRQRCNWAGGRYSPREIAGDPIGSAGEPTQGRLDVRLRRPIAQGSLFARCGGDGGMLMSLLPFVLIFVIMYFLILRPQQKRAKQHQEMVKNVRRGDTVVTTGGLVGKVTKVVDDDQIEIEIADDVRIRQMRADGHRGARQGRAGEGRGRGQLRSQRHRSRTASRDVMLYFTRWKVLAILLHGGRRLPVRGAQFPSRQDGAELAEMGAAPRRARPRPAGRLAYPARGRHQGACARRSSRRCATTCAACCATRASATPAWWCAATASRCASAKGRIPGRR